MIAVSCWGIGRVQQNRLVWTFLFKTRHRSLGETRRHGGSFLIKRWYSVLCHFLQSKSHFSVLEIKWVSLTQVPSYLIASYFYVSRRAVVFLLFVCPLFLVSKRSAKLVQQCPKICYIYIYIYEMYMIWCVNI